MEKVYAPQAIERRIYERWESHGWFAPSGRGEPYCIMIPPPNVTGTLHMGHAFQHTLMDAMPCGSPAPTTRASPRRWWWSGS